jgi:hypothetical protein
LVLNKLGANKLSAEPCAAADGIYAVTEASLPDCSSTRSDVAALKALKELILLHGGNSTDLEKWSTMDPGNAGK